MLPFPPFNLTADSKLPPIDAPTSQGVVLQIDADFVAQQVEYFNEIYQNALIRISWDRLNSYLGTLNAIHRRIWLVHDTHAIMPCEDMTGAAIAQDIRRIGKEMEFRIHIVQLRRDSQSPSS